jgi:hypothetical protein
VVGLSQILVPSGRAFTVTVYVWASAVFVECANLILVAVVVKKDKDIRLPVALEGEYVTW